MRVLCGFLMFLICDYGGGVGFLMLFICDYGRVCELFTCVLRVHRRGLGAPRVCLLLHIDVGPWVFLMCVLIHCRVGCGFPCVVLTSLRCGFWFAFMYASLHADLGFGFLCVDLRVLMAVHVCFLWCVCRFEVSRVNI